MRRVWFLAVVVVEIAVVQLAGPASAEIARVVVTDSGPMGTFGGREYTWVTAAMEGTVERDDGTTGHYRVPISLYFPDRDSNGFGFVDVVAGSGFGYWSEGSGPLGRPTVAYTGNSIFSDFLRLEGFSYVSVQWARRVTEVLGPDYGIIEDGYDGYEIIKDAARLLRDPQKLEGLLPFHPIAVYWVIGHGMSIGAGTVRGMVLLGENRDKLGALVFDGMLLTAHNGQNCGVLTNDDTPRDVPGRPAIPAYFQGGQPCMELPRDGKMITVRTQSEQERRDYQLILGDTTHRVYEVAGVAHIPPFLRPLGHIGASRQNPASWQPVAKAMLRHLVDWIVDDTVPPLSLYLDGTEGADGTYQLNTDDYGNVLGGIRLPHMPSVFPNGERAGAPLGVYGGSDPTLDPSDGYGFAGLGGTFEPFSPVEIARRYPTREVYVDLVRNAADALFADGYILEEDRDAYIRAAERQPIAPVVIDPFAVITDGAPAQSVE